MTRFRRQRFKRTRHGAYMPVPAKPTAREFADALEENEEHMAEIAAMAVTCEQFGISEEEGYDLLIALSDDAVDAVEGAT